MLNHLGCAGMSLLMTIAGANETANLRQMQFDAKTPEEARIWQKQARKKLFELMMGGKMPDKVPLNAELIKRVEVADESYYLEELMIDSLPNRKVHVWLAMQKDAPKEGLPAMLTLHGHGGTALEIVNGERLYWYGKALAQKGYVVISLDLGQHDLQHEDWSLMGERTWDALATLDYLCSRPEVDKDRVGTAGLSLGGESVMYVAAMDERLKVAVSSGWLNTIANMKQGHCPCWNFKDLRKTSISAIYSRSLRQDHL